MRTNLAAFGMPFVIAFALGAPAHAQSGKNPPGVNPTHYQCYSVEVSNESTVRSLRDQFGASDGVKVGTAVFLCAPTSKNGAAVRDRTTHYLCYKDDVKAPGKRARIINQLTKADGVPVTVGRGELLCVPSLKRLL
jgi:hypothetical protein